MPPVDRSRSRAPSLSCRPSKVTPCHTDFTGLRSFLSAGKIFLFFEFISGRPGLARCIATWMAADSELGIWSLLFCGVVRKVTFRPNPIIKIVNFWARHVKIIYPQSDSLNKAWKIYHFSLYKIFKYLQVPNFGPALHCRHSRVYYTGGRGPSGP